MNFLMHYVKGEGTGNFLACIVKKEIREQAHIWIIPKEKLYNTPSNF